MLWADVIAGRSLWSCEQADCREWLADVPTGSVHCCVTSPPYWGLRDYGHADQIGLEPTPAEYVARMVAVFAEVRRILHPSGTFFLNLGDSFNNAGSSRNGEGLDGSRRGGATGADGELGYKRRDNRRAFGDIGIKHKDLVGIPWLVAFALRADGWYLRQRCPWVKRNPMPESVTDRPGTACEEVFLLTKQADYFFDMEAVKKQSGYRESGNKSKTWGSNETATRAEGVGEVETMRGIPWEGETRNFRNSDLWFDSVGMLLADNGDMLGIDVPVKGLKAAHFAVMPEALVEPLILAGTSAKGVCPQCGEPWVRVVEKDRKATRPGDESKVYKVSKSFTTGSPHRNAMEMKPRARKSDEVGNRDPERHCTTTRTVGWEAGCDCNAGEPVPAVVLDPFTGAGTVAKVSVNHGRRFIGCELNPEYLKIINKRMRGAKPPLFTGAAT